MSDVSVEIELQWNQSVAEDRRKMRHYEKMEDWFKWWIKRSHERIKDAIDFILQQKQNGISATVHLWMTDSPDGDGYYLDIYFEVDPWHVVIEIEDSGGDETVAYVSVPPWKTEP